MLLEVAEIPEPVGRMLGSTSGVQALRPASLRARREARDRAAQGEPE